MSDSKVLQDISDDLRYLIKSTVPNSVYKNESDPEPGGGGGGGALVVHWNEDYTGLDKTFTEIFTVAQNGYVALENETDGAYIYVALFEVDYMPDEDNYAVTFGVGDDASTFVATTENDYPVWVDPNA